MMNDLFFIFVVLGNEVEVGKGINQAIAEGVVQREDLWITSKLWNTYRKIFAIILDYKKKKF